MKTKKTKTRIILFALVFVAGLASVPAAAKSTRSPSGHASLAAKKPVVFAEADFESVLRSEEHGLIDLSESDREPIHYEERFSRLAEEAE